MRKLIYLVFENGTVHAAFTRDSDFDHQLWVARNNAFLKEVGVAEVKLGKVPDDFRLPWEIA